MSNPYSVLSEDDIGQEGEQKLVDFFHFKSLKANVKVLLANSNFQQDKNKISSSLLECSSLYGYFVAGSCTGFVLGQTAKLRAKVHAASKTEKVPFDETISVDIKDGDVNIIALSADQLQLFVGLSGGILLTFNVHDIIKNRENALPVQSQSMGSEISFIKPNPEFYPDIVAVCTNNHELRLIRYMQKQIILTVNNVTSLSWSPKGKQIICGTVDGMLYAYDLEGNPKDEIAAPLAVQSNHYVNAVLWIENHVFFAVYASSEGEEHTHSAYIIDRKQPEDKKYILLDEINPIFDVDAPDSYFYMYTLHHLGPAIQTLIVIANAGTNELAVVGKDDDGAWATWTLDEASMPRLPLSEDGISDTYPVGLTFDLSANEPLDPFDAAESETPVPAMPILYFLTNEGSICAYHAYNDELAKSSGRYQGMVEAKSVDQIPAPLAPSNAPTSIEHKPTFGSPTPTKIPSFNSMMTANKSATSQPIAPSPFASLSSESPKFGSTSSIGHGFGSSAPSQKQAVPFASLTRPSSSETKLPTAFGSTTSFGANNVTPTFGSTTSFGAGGFESTGAFKSATPSFGGFKNVTSSSPGKPFGDVSFSDTITTSKFAPSTLDVKVDEEKKTSTDKENKTSIFANSTLDATAEDDKQTKLVETEKSISKFAVSTLDANNQQEEKRNTSKFTPSILNPDDDERNKPTESEQKKTPIFAPSILGAEGDKKKMADSEEKEPAEEERISIVETKEKKPDNEDQQEATARSGLEPQSIDNVDTDVDVPSKKSTPTEPASCSMSFEVLQKTLEADDTGSDLSEISNIRDSANDNSEDDYYQQDNSSNDQEESEKEEKQKLEEEGEILADEISLSEENQVEEEKKVAKKEEENRLAEEKRKEEERIAEEKRKEKERIDEEKRKEEERIAEEKRKEKERLEAVRIAEEQRLEAERIAEEERLEAERIAEEERLEAERIAEEERLAAIKPDPLFAIREPRQYEPTVYKRTPGIQPMAKDFEELYFSTLEEMESTHVVLKDIKDEFAFQRRSAFALKDTSYLENLEFVWKLSDNEDISGMMNILIQEAEEADIRLKQLKKSLDNLCEENDGFAVKKDILVSCIDTKQAEEALKNIDLDNEIVSQYNEIKTKSTETEKTLEELQNKLDECKSKLVQKPATTSQSNLTLYTLRRTVRDIERTIAKEKAKLTAMEEEELNLHKKEGTSSTCVSDSSSSARLTSSKASQRRVASKNPFLNLVFQRVNQPLHA